MSVRIELLNFIGEVIRHIKVPTTVARHGISIRHSGDKVLINKRPVVAVFRNALVLNTNEYRRLKRGADDQCNNDGSEYFFS